MSVLDDSDIEAGEGGDAGGSPPRNEEIEGLKRALSAARNQNGSLKSEMADLKAKVDALSQKPAKEYTRSELQSIVDDGRMSQDEADRILNDQMRRSIKDEVTKEVKTSLESESLQGRLNAEIDKYTDVYPNILVEGSEERLLVAQEFQRQMGLGKPNTLQTELDALSVVFGPSSRLQKGKEKERETHQDVGSDGGETRKAGGPKLPSHVKSHYEKMIDKGMYKGWDDPALKSEIETYARPGW